MNRLVLLLVLTLLISCTSEAKKDHKESTNPPQNNSEEELRIPTKTGPKNGLESDHSKAKTTELEREVEAPSFSSYCRNLPCYSSKTRAEDDALIDEATVNVFESHTFEIPFLEPKKSNKKQDHKMISDPVVLSDSKIVTKMIDGRIHWIDQNGQKIAEAKQQGSRSDMIVLSNDTVVTSNTYGEVQGFQSGHLVFEASLGKVQALIAKPDDTIIITTEDQIYWLKDGKRLAQIDIPNEDTPVKNGIGLLSDGTLVVLAKKKKPSSNEEDPRNRVYWFKNKILTHSTEDYTQGNALGVLPNDNVVVTGRTGAQWLRDGEVIHQFSGYKTQYATKPAFLLDGTAVFQIRNGNYVDLVWVKDGVKKHSITIGSKYLGLEAPVALDSGVIVVGSRNKHLYLFKDGFVMLKVYAYDYLSTTPIVLKDGTIILGSYSGNLMWFSQERDPTQIQQPKEIKATALVESVSGSGFQCSSFSVSSRKTKNMTFTFTKYRQTTLIYKTDRKCKIGNTKTYIQPDKSFRITCHYDHFKNIKIAGVVEGDEITITEYEEESCSPNGRGFSVWNGKLAD